MCQAQDAFTQTTFRFLNIPHSSRQQYLGRAALVSYDYDCSIAAANPSLIHDDMRGKLMVSTNFYFQSIFSNLAYFTANDKLELPMMIGVNAIAYPLQQSTNVDGSLGSKFNPIEMSVYAAGAKDWDKYRIGAGAKIIYGSYYLSQNAAIAFDASAMYVDDLRNIQATLVLKNMGFQFLGTESSNYATPFDIQIGFSKRLQKLPFRYTVMAHSVHIWDHDNYSQDYGIWPLDPYYERNQSTFNRILNHFVFSGEFYIGQGFRMGLSYDFKRDNELTFKNYYRGIPGVSFGCAIYSRKFELGYSLAKLSASGAAHQLTFVLNLRDWALLKR